MTQSEQELEQNLIECLTGLGYEPVTIRNAAELTPNLIEGDRYHPQRCQ